LNILQGFRRERRRAEIILKVCLFVLSAAKFMFAIKLRNANSVKVLKVNIAMDVFLGLDSFNSCSLKTRK